MTGLYFLEWTESYYTRTATDDLRRESRAMAAVVASTPEYLPAVVDRMGRDLSHRITIIRADGEVLADSSHDYRRMSNHANRPEVREALDYGVGQSTRFSATLKTRMLYVASAYGPKDRPAGVARVARSLSGLDGVMRAIQRTFLTAGLVAIAVAALLSVKIASSITQPISSIAEAARGLEHGDLGVRVPPLPPTARELTELAATFNRTAQRLQINIDEMNRQSARMQAVFDHTDNGLILVDTESRVHMINPAACRIVNAECPWIVGKTLIEGTLSHDLAGLVERVCRTQEPAALDVDLSSEDTRGVQSAVHAYVAPIPRADGEIDVLVVLHDVTSIRELEAIRRDFVANVSHELRTPLASIKAMAETIILRQAGDPGAVRGFAQSIVQEADRMTLLAEDLLDLTKIESQRRDVNVELLKPGEIAGEVIERLAGSAEKKSIALTNEIPSETRVEADRDSLAQVLVNLVDNAIKYTHEGGSVNVRADRTSGHTAIRVVDNGMGIPSMDLPRVFERFYRVDKARSRESGGTGLGLAIVKHLCEQMGGSVSVKSEVGKGSTFSILLPVGHDNEVPGGQS